MLLEPRKSDSRTSPPSSCGTRPMPTVFRCETRWMVISFPSLYSLKTFGLYKDGKEITIHLVSHLKTVGIGRVPHEEGGEVLLSDFRGSRSIGFWASYAIAVQRNTQAETLEEKTTTYLKIVKDRDQGIYTGHKVVLVGDSDTGNLMEPSQRRKSTPVDTPDKPTPLREEGTEDFG